MIIILTLLNLVLQDESNFGDLQVLEAINSQPSIEVWISAGRSSIVRPDVSSRIWILENCQFDTGNFQFTIASSVSLYNKGLCSDEDLEIEFVVPEMSEDLLSYLEQNNSSQNNVFRWVRFDAHDPQYLQSEYYLLTDSEDKLSGAITCGTNFSSMNVCDENPDEFQIWSFR